MNKVDFIEKNEFHIRSRKLFGDPTTPTMIKILLKTGLARNEKQALLILTIIIFASLIVTSWILYTDIVPPTNTTILDQTGKSYTIEEYVDLVKQGKDPLLPK